MSAIKSIVARLYRDNRGVSMVEYSILIGLITAAAVRLIAAQTPKIIAARTTLDTAPGEAQSTLEEALRRDPDNAYIQANLELLASWSTGERHPDDVPRRH
jgi:Flp pilus assembly pilin Flp